MLNWFLSGAGRLELYLECSSRAKERHSAVGVSEAGIEAKETPKKVPKQDLGCKNSTEDSLVS